MNSPHHAIPTIHFNPTTPQQIEEYVYDVGGTAIDDGIYENAQQINTVYENAIPPRRNAKQTPKSSSRICIFIAITIVLSMGVVGSVVLGVLALDKIQKADYEISRIDQNMGSELQNIQISVQSINFSNEELNDVFQTFAENTGGELQSLQKGLTDIQQAIPHFGAGAAGNNSQIEYNNESIVVLEENLQNLKERVDVLQRQLNSFTIRLVGSSVPSNGRVEILHDGAWGTICDDLWRLTDATVICRMLGFESAINAWRSAHYGEGTGQIWLDNVQCTGNEVNIAECRHNGWGVHDCSHDEDASVDCE